MAQKFVYIGNMRAGTQIASRVVEAGFEPATEVESADMVVTYIPSTGNQEDAYFGTDGIIARANPGTIIVDLSPTSPTFAREISAMAAVNDMHLVEAPLVLHDITSSTAFGQPGNISLFVGGDSADVAAAQPLLDAISSEQIHCGAAGQGQMARCAASLMRISQLLSLVEAHMLVRATSDARPDCFGNAIKALNPPDWLRALASAVESHDYEGAYTVEMAFGDLSSAINAAEDAGLAIPHSEAAEYLLDMLDLVGGADMGIASVALIYMDEQTSAKFGIDWSRVDSMYGAMGHEGHDHDHDHDHGHHHGYDDDDYYEDDYYDDYDGPNGMNGFDDGSAFGGGMGFDGKGRFGGYSAN